MEKQIGSNIIFTASGGKRRLTIHFLHQVLFSSHTCIYLYYVILYKLSQEEIIN